LICNTEQCLLEYSTTSQYILSPPQLGELCLNLTSSPQSVFRNMSTVCWGCCQN